MKELLSIYWTCMKVGAMTFGGGYAMLPIMQREIVERKQWNTEEEILDYYAMAQCIMGALMVNTLCFVGQKRRGAAGAIAAALGAATPSLLIISLIASVLSVFSDVTMVQHAFAGIRVCVCVLIFNSIVKLWKSSVVDRKCLALFIAITAGSLFLEVTPVVFVVGAAILGILLQKMGGAA